VGESGEISASIFMSRSIHSTTLKLEPKKGVSAALDGLSLVLFGVTTAFCRRPTVGLVLSLMGVFTLL
jgi:hypothetical protein